MPCWFESETREIACIYRPRPVASAHEVSDHTMQKTHTILLLLTLSTALTLFIAACGGAQTEEETTPPAETPAKAAPEASEESASEEDDPFSGWKIGTVDNELVLYLEPLDIAFPHPGKGFGTLDEMQRDVCGGLDAGVTTYCMALLNGAAEHSYIITIFALEVPPVAWVANTHKRRIERARADGDTTIRGARFVENEVIGAGSRVWTSVESQGVHTYSETGVFTIEDNPQPYGMMIVQSSSNPSRLPPPESDEDPAPQSGDDEATLPSND
jgi:hypothetical protein